MPLQDLLLRARSFRRFQQEAVSEQTLMKLIELARLCPSAANRQPLKYVLAWTPEQTEAIFPHLRWAAALAPWTGPSEQERPTAYIIILGDTNVSRQFSVDCGIVAQTIQLAATEQGLGACMVGSIDRPALRSALVIPEYLEIPLVIGLGKPSEVVVLEEGRPEERPYWRDEEDVHHVPKRSLSELRLE
mgnify:FL=1